MGERRLTLTTHLDTPQRQHMLRGLTPELATARIEDWLESATGWLALSDDGADADASGSLTPLAGSMIETGWGTLTDAGHAVTEWQRLRRHCGQMVMIEATLTKDVAEMGTDVDGDDEDWTAAAANRIAVQPPTRTLTWDEPWPDYDEAHSRCPKSARTAVRRGHRALTLMQRIHALWTWDPDVTVTQWLTAAGAPAAMRVRLADNGTTGRVDVGPRPGTATNQEHRDRISYGCHTTTDLRAAVAAALEEHLSPAAVARAAHNRERKERRNDERTRR